MIIGIASGKGGTGKTTIATNLALSITNAQYLDCDVEEPNAHIFLKPEITRTEKVMIDVPLIDKEKCTHCGICSEACEFNALIAVPNHILFFSELCMSCGACYELCPEKAISLQKKEIGLISVGKTKKDVLFANGLLKISHPRAIPIVEDLKKKIDPNHTTILDAPPGNSCLVMETIRDVDYCLLVTEPTPFGLWDLRIAVEVCRIFDLKFGIIINRAGLGDDTLIEDYCQQENLPILLKVPFDRAIAEAYSQGKMLVEYDKEWLKKFQQLFNQIEKEVKNHG